MTGGGGAHLRKINSYWCRSHDVHVLVDML